jgi:hypothetical protein
VGLTHKAEKLPQSSLGPLNLPAAYSDPREELINLTLQTKQWQLKKTSKISSAY